MVNAVGGGGSLLTFPALIFAGLPAITANVTSSVALLPGLLGSSFAYRRELRPQGRRVGVLALTGAAGGLSGSLLLLASPGPLFRHLAPYLILLACALLLAQPLLRRVLGTIREHQHAHRSLRLHLPLFAVAVYGGYFGAGMGIMILAFLTLTIDDDPQSLNALKGILALVINAVAGIYFIFFGPVVWSVVAIMALAALAGGLVGVALAKRLSATALRGAVVVYGVFAALRMLT